MRVTESSINTTVINGLQQSLSGLSSLEESISSGKRVNEPSDDPLAASKITSLNDLISQNMTL
ncbi:MAG: hypothetical protein ABSG42_05310 [Nitrospirota bacterium]